MFSKKAVIFGLSWPLLLLSNHQVHSLAFVERNQLAGIWKLELDPAGALNKKSSSPPVTIRLQDDGSFEQFDDESCDRCIHGCWDYEDGQLQLAIDRRCLLSQGDTLLSGKVSKKGKKTEATPTTVDVVAKGDVSAGKFMYPTSHASFFENVMAASDVVGKFSLKQVMSFNSFTFPSLGGEGKEAEKNENSATNEPTFRADDFFGRQFAMTVVPIECKVKPQDVWDNQLKLWRNPLDDQAVDIRTMDIQFFKNSTFQAFAMNKILRGRFEVSNSNDDEGEGVDELWFHVSRFGMGRSTPGSVYSEGIGLSHEDERTYIGKIEAIGDKLRVQGKVTFGADLGSDARPEPVGEFLLTELRDDSIEEGDTTPVSSANDESEEAIDNDDDIFNSVFE